MIVMGIQEAGANVLTQRWHCSSVYDLCISQKQNHKPLESAAAPLWS